MLETMQNVNYVGIKKNKVIKIAYNTLVRLSKMREIKKRYENSECYKCGTKLTSIHIAENRFTKKPYCRKCNIIRPNEKSDILDSLFKLI